ncbi:hypothetical protein D3C80_1567710 [compost metagenome]
MDQLQLGNIQLLDFHYNNFDDNLLPRKKLQKVLTALQLDQHMQAVLLQILSQQFLSVHRYGTE